MGKAIAALCLAGQLTLSPASYAGCLDQLTEGATLIAKTTIVAWVEENQRHDGYEGCAYGRILVFSDNRGVMCSSYSYHYTYRPTALVFSGPSGLQMCVDNEWMQVRQIR